MERRGSRLSRRAFVGGAAGLGLLAGCGRLPGQAAMPARLYRIGLLWGARTPDSPEADAFRQGLHEYGWREGENIALEYRMAEGRRERLAPFAAELVQLPVDIIVTGGPDATLAAKQATSSIPIVIANTPDAVEEGLVASLARPGGNVTGLTAMRRQMAGKRLELLKATLPGVSHAAAISGRGGPQLDIKMAQDAARILGVRLSPMEVNGASSLQDALDAAVRDNAGAIMVLSDQFLLASHARVVQLAAERGIPVMYDDRAYMDAGGLMVYAPNSPSLVRRAAYYVDRILKGTKPADLPVEQPMRFDFVVNMKTARELGITFPNEIMLQVTEVIQ
jgi:putative tryptophan/tyrosine transport system substrate-binding protein